MRVLRARGIESEARVPFAGLLELLRPALGALDRIPEPQAAALGGALALRPATAQDRFAVGAATLSLLAAYAEDAPVAALVDDAHWLDGSSADALLFAVRRLVADPIAVVVAVREGEPSFLDGADLPTLHLGGLDRGCRRRPRRRGGRRPAVRGNGRQPARAARARAGGRAPDRSADRRAAADRGQRRAGVPPARRSAAGADAARARWSPPRATRASCRRSSARTRGRPGELVPAEAAGLVALRDGQVQFRHSLARSAVYGRGARGAARSARGAGASAAGPRRRPPRLAPRARHRRPRRDRRVGARAGRRPRHAAQRLRRRGAPRSSARRRSRRDPARLLYQAADAAWLAGQAERAISLLDEAQPGRRRPAARGRDRAPARPDRGAARAGAEGRDDPGRGGRARGGSRSRARGDHARRGGAPVVLSPATPARCSRTAERADELAAGTGRTCADPRGARAGMALVLAGEGEAGARSIRAAVAALEASDELRDDPHLALWAAHGPLWLREAEAGAASTSARSSPSAAERRSACCPSSSLHVARD